MRQNEKRQNLYQKTAACLTVSMLLGLAAPAGTGTFAGTVFGAEAGKENKNTAEAQSNAAGTDMQDTGTQDTGTVYDSAYDPSLVHVDETMYVNLDYYGSVRSANVVKGISTSKNIRYQDYGTYSKVLNMTNDEALDLTDQGVSFNVDGNGKKFFFQGTVPTENLQLPWNVEVKYKLNGVPVEAEALRGASGLVELNVKVTPNDAASEYLKDNMLLSVIIPADSSIYSVDAPGSQTQSVGDITGVAFTALPGEEKEFVARLGTDSYESIGVIIMMMPATLDSFDNIVDIKNLKDTWKESGDELYDSLNQLLDVTSSLRSEMGGIRQSLNAAESARAKISGAKAGIFSAADEALASVMDLSVSVQKMIPYLSTAQTALSEINQDVNAMVDTLGDMTESLHTLYRGLNRLEDGAYGVKYDMSELSSILEKLRGDQAAFEGHLNHFYDTIDKILEWLDPGKSAYELFGFEEDELANIEDIMSEYGYENADIEAALESAEGEAAEGEKPEAEKSEADAEAAGDAAEGEASDDKATQSDARRAPSSGASAAVRSDGQTVSSLLSQLGAGGNIISQLRSILQKLRDKQSVMDHIATASSALLDDGERLLSGAGKTAQGAKYTSDDLRRMIERTEDLNDTMNVFYPDMQSALSETQSLLGQTGNTLNNAGVALSMAHEALKDASGDADTALSQSIQSSLSMIEKTFGMFDALDGLQSAGGTAKDALDGEVDRFENENRFLDMDPNAEKVSFTSDQNKVPDSLQIVLRTDEISADDNEAEVLDADQPAADIGLWQRIKNVFIQIFEAIKNIFGNLN